MLQKTEWADAPPHSGVVVVESVVKLNKICTRSALPGEWQSINFIHSPDVDNDNHDDDDDEVTGLGKLIFAA